MKNHLTIFLVFNWLFALLLIVLGVANLILVHPVPGIAYLLVSLMYLPPVNTSLQKHLDFSVHFTLKLFLSLVIILFTFGVSDLGNLIDGW